MTDFEKAALFAEYLSVANTIFAGYLALLFAVFTASYFLAAKMNRWVATMFLILFTFGTLGLGMGSIFAFGDFGRLGVYIAETSSVTGDLRWLGPLYGDGASMGSMQTITAVIVSISYAACVGFFFLARRNHDYRFSEESLLEEESGSE